MIAEEVVKAIEEFAPIYNQEAWDNSGFIIGNKKREVKSALLALDCTEEVVDEAVLGGYDMIITHHPLIFKGVKKIAPDNYTGRIIERCIKHDIIVYSAHTNIDKAAGGVSGLMAEKLNMKECEPLTEEGFGLVGKLDESIDSKTLINRMKELFNLDNIRTSELLKDKIDKIAVCGGSGHSFINNAMQKGAQVYITGDISYHEFYCERGFMIMDIGHYGSEYDVVGLFSKIISKKIPTFAVSISKNNNNPIYYY